MYIAIYLKNFYYKWIQRFGSLIRKAEVELLAGRDYGPDNNVLFVPAPALDCYLVSTLFEAYPPQFGVHGS